VSGEYNQSTNQGFRPANEGKANAGKAQATTIPLVVTNGAFRAGSQGRVQSIIRNDDPLLSMSLVFDPDATEDSATLLAPGEFFVIGGDVGLVWEGEATIPGWFVFADSGTPQFKFQNSVRFTR